MAIDKIKLKRTLAKEILLFFSGLGLIGLVWGFVLLRNSYYDHKAISCTEKIKSLKTNLDSLPSDYIKELYDLTNKDFVVNYQLGKDNYAIPKKYEQEFLYDEYGIKKNVLKLPNSPKGYSYFHFDRQSIYFFRKYSLHQINPKRTQTLKDSTIVFDYVELNIFREFVKSPDYQEKLFTVFSNNPDMDEWLNEVPANLSKPEFDPFIPNSGILDLGTLSEFKSKILRGLKYNEQVIQKKNRIKSEIQNQIEVTTNSKSSILTTSEIHNSLFYTLIAIGLFLYPFRLTIFLILWAFKTINQK